MTVDLFGEKVEEPSNDNFNASTRTRTRESDVWLTPPWILEGLGPFDLDPCAAPEPRPWSTAETMLTLPTNGLVAPWSGRVWLNPPYGPETGGWLRRLWSHGDGIALVFLRSDTRWWNERVWAEAAAIFAFSKRIVFHYPDGRPSRAGASAPSALIAYGERNVEAIRHAAVDHDFHGALLERWEHHP